MSQRMEECPVVEPDIDNMEETTRIMLLMLTVIKEDPENLSLPSILDKVEAHPTFTGQPAELKIIEGIRNTSYGTFNSLPPSITQIAQRDHTTPDKTPSEVPTNVEKTTTFVEKLQSNVPHLYYITTQLVLPLLTMIAMAFFFGFLLAEIEMKEEIKSNDVILREFLLKYNEESIETTTIWRAMANTSVQCFTESIDSQVIETIPNITSTLENVQTCSLDQGNRSFPIQPYYSYLFESCLGLVPQSFNWMVCDPPVGYDQKTTYDETFLIQELGLNPFSKRNRQVFRYTFNFGADIVTKAQEIYPDNDFDNFWEYFNALAILNEEELHDIINNATGSNGCKVHTAGGALFWFTIMTTIGYGNTAPETDAGKFLVYTCGFLTIVCFMALNAEAAHVWKHMFDDVFLRCKLQKLVVGPLSVLFWLGMLILWISIVAFSLQAEFTNRIEEELPLSDFWWFSYITITTVGLGDFHFPHEEFASKDMFMVPLFILIGFNNVNIFAEKVFACYVLYFPGQNAFEKVLQERREKEAEERALQTVGASSTEEQS